MEIKLSEVLNLYTAEDVDNFLLKYSHVNTNKINLNYEQVETMFCPVGNNRYNNSTISILPKAEKGVVERITNAIDAVLEKEFEKCDKTKVFTPEDIIKQSFPHFYNNRNNLNIDSEKKQKNVALEAENLVCFYVNDSSQNNKPTLEVTDKGIGIPADKFESTILSLQNGNKSQTSKSYLIGTFGQGGSTALPFSHSTIILSKYKNSYAFTIIKECSFEGYKMNVFMYLKPNNEIQTLINDNIIDEKYEHLRDFLHSESGTLIRMVESEIDRELYSNDATKPTKFIDYLNTELYKTPIPVHIEDNRRCAKEDAKTQEEKNADQNRNVYGSYYKLKTAKTNNKKEYFEQISFEFKGKDFKANCYAILPSKEEDWGKDSECKKKYKEYNIHENPIIYIMNGQYISSTRFTKIKNNGLPHLQYRILVEVNLDMFGSNKYKMVSTSRNELKITDDVKELEDKLIKAICKSSTFQELDKKIQEKALKTNISEDIIKDYEKILEKNFSEYLRSTTKVKKYRESGQPLGGQTPESKLINEVKELNISTQDKKEFFKDEPILFIVKTKATKEANENTIKDICVFVGSKGLRPKNIQGNCISKSKGGRIEFEINGLNPGEYDIQFEINKDIYNRILSEKQTFTIKDENNPDSKTEIKSMAKKWNIIIEEAQDKDLIIDISKNEETKTITIIYFLNHEILNQNVFDDLKTEDTTELKSKLMVPLAGFVLGFQEGYEQLEPDMKNNIVSAFCASFKSSNK